jgi:hypothetical protein
LYILCDAALLGLGNILGGFVRMSYTISLRINSGNVLEAFHPDFTAYENAELATKVILECMDLSYEWYISTYYAGLPEYLRLWMRGETLKSCKMEKKIR